MNILEDKSLLRRLAMTAARMEVHAHKFIFEPFNLTMIGAKIMFIIKKYGPLKPTDFLRFVGGTISNLTQRINLLERNGYITRSASDDDGRSVILKLTPKGDQLLNTLITTADKHISEFEKQLTPEEIKVFQNILDKLNGMLDVHSCTKRI